MGLIQFYCIILVICLAAVCQSFPASEQIEAPESSKSERNKGLVAVFIRNPGQGRDSEGKKVPQERKLQEIYNWLRPFLGLGSNNGAPGTN
ncbi:hypothetical protein L9F63_004111, partial [Diploptera punctata]